MLDITFGTVQRISPSLAYQRYCTPHFTSPFPSELIEDCQENIIAQYVHVYDLANCVQQQQVSDHEGIALHLARCTLSTLEDVVCELMGIQPGCPEIAP